MIRREHGQVTVAGVGIAVMIALGAVVLLHLAAIRSGGAHGQSAADIAALSAARVLADNPDASADRVRAAAERAAAANGARVERFRIEGDSGLPEAVDVTVSELVSGSVPGAGERHDRVRSWSRAGVAYTAELPQGSFRPVNLAGAKGATAVVMAAEAQIGWPYVWGGESRAEGGFDCSGLIDYAYGAAGMPLPGRPTAAVLYSMSRRIAPSELAPGDLVFMGSPAAYHVGMYVGGGMTVVAPHTGAVVSFEPLAENSWDGFGRLLPGAPINDPLPTRTAGAAMTYGVPPNVLQALTALKPTTDPVTLAASLKDALGEHHNDLMAALTALLDGNASSAALVMRAASGPALPVTGTIKLLPRAEKYYESGDSSGGNSWSGILGPIEHGVNWLKELRERGGLRFPRHLGHGAHLGLDVASLLPNKTAAAFGQVVSAGRDLIGVAADFKGVVEMSARMRAFGGVLSFVQVGFALWGLYHSRSRRQKIYNAAMLVGGVAGILALVFAGTFAAPFLLAGAVGITAAATIYANWGTIVGALGRWGSAERKYERRAFHAVSSGVRRVASKARDMASSARDAVTGWLA